MKIKLLILLLILAGKSFGQPIALWNASFEEDVRSFGYMDRGWYNCGSAQETPPDIQPGTHKIDLPAADGRHYVSMVVRDDNSREIIGQALTKPLQKDSFYILTLSVARSIQMMSATKSSKEIVSFATPVGLKVWGGDSPCDKKQLLAEIPPVIHTEWKAMELDLQPEMEITHIFLEACHKTPNLFPYNGNLLIDNLSLSQMP